MSYMSGDFCFVKPMISSASFLKNIRGVFFIEYDLTEISAWEHSGDGNIPRNRTGEISEIERFL